MKPGVAALLCLFALSATAVTVVRRSGWTLYYGDAEAHLTIARRVVDSRTPGYDQIGTVWLPLPHALMLPFVGVDTLWRNGMAGAIPGSACFILAGLFLFGIARRAFRSVPAAAAATACFALNPNLLYLQATPMTESVFAASLLALLYCTVAYRETPSIWLVIGAALANLSAALTRYEGWFLIAFATLFFLIAAPSRKLQTAVLFGAIASAGPLWWLAHNYWFFGNPLDFFNGPYSAKAIQGGLTYPGDHDLPTAWLYYRSTVEIVSGWGVMLPAAVGAVVLARRRQWWPLFFLGLPPVFYMWSIYSSSTPIHIPSLPPHSYYNSRYGLSALPLLAFGAGAAVLSAPGRFRSLVAASVVFLAVLPWIASPHPESWICWKESQVNSESRRAWTTQTAAFLKSRYQPGAGVFSTLGDLAGVYREAEIPLREVLQEGNGPAWDAALARPDLMLQEEWAVAIDGDKVSKSVESPNSRGRYRRVAIIGVKDSPPVVIYRRN